jgi:hypothetical protein
MVSGKTGSFRRPPKLAGIIAPVREIAKTNIGPIFAAGNVFFGSFFAAPRTR